MASLCQRREGGGGSGREVGENDGKRKWDYTNEIMQLGKENYHSKPPFIAFYHLMASMPVKSQYDKDVPATLPRCPNHTS